MKSNRYTRTLTIILSLILIIGCDQASKIIVRSRMGPYSSYSFFNHHLTLQKVENSGAFLSLGDSLNSTQKDILFNIVPFLILILGLVFIFRKKSLDIFTLSGVILIIGGGFGNLYDRVLYSSVTDFMHIKFGSLQTGVFNVADMCIMAGTFIILIKTFSKRKSVENAAPSESST